MGRTVDATTQMLLFIVCNIQPSAWTEEDPFNNFRDNAGLHIYGGTRMQLADTPAAIAQRIDAGSNLTQVPHRVQVPDFFNLGTFSKCNPIEISTKSWSLYI